jgi:prevent-host-death family protein
MTSVSAYEAKTHFSALLERAGGGESIVVTRHGRPVAKLVPYDAAEPVDDVIASLRRVREGVRLDGLAVRDLIDDGRRF